MKEVLLQTHKESNILHLRARDYYFIQAKKFHQWKSIFVFLPTVLTILTYFVVFVFSTPSFTEAFPAITGMKDIVMDGMDLALGTVTIACFFIAKLLGEKSDFMREKSNIQREIYDNIVFGLKPNLFSYDYKSAKKDKAVGKLCPEDYNGWKYEYWYDEIFSDDTDRNILCMQMDNALYSYHVFVLCKENYIIHFSLLLSLLAVLLVCAYWINGWKTCVLVAFAMFELINGKWEEIKIAEDIINRNKKLIDTVSDPENTSEILADLQHHVFCIEQCMIENRKMGLFLPKRVRNTYIDYYDELNEIRSRFLDDETTTFPESSSEIEIYTTDERKTHTLKQLQDRIKTILDGVVSVFERNAIPYYLDRGTLLGAVRPAASGINSRKDQRKECESSPNGGFLFWDDMIQITIPREHEQRAKMLIQEAYPYWLTIQDSETENLLSFNRYSFRVREKNDMSSIHTKELLSPLFHEKGVYITVNTIGPIVVNPRVDHCTRTILFSDVLKKMDKGRQKLYRLYLNGSKAKLDEARHRYGKYTEKYRRRLQFYTRWAKNKQWLCYTPGNRRQYEVFEIERIIKERLFKLKNTGKRRMWTIHKRKKEKYVPVGLIWGKEKKGNFEGKAYTIPNDCENYLEILYGKDWCVSPFSRKEDLKKELGNRWYSTANRFHVSSLKNTRHVDFHEGDIV